MAASRPTPTHENTAATRRRDPRGFPRAPASRPGPTARAGRASARARAGRAAPTRAVTLALACTALVLYGSLFPLTGWTVLSLDSRYRSLFPLTGWSAPSTGSGAVRDILWPRHLPRADVVTNLIAYVPVGVTWALALGRLPAARAASAVILLGVALSVGVELAQLFIPGRVTSLVDVLANSAGCAVGVLVARVFCGYEPLTGRLRAVRDAWARPGRLADVSLAALGLWAASQLSPFLPSLDVGNLRHGLRLLGRALETPSLMSSWQTAIYALDITGLGLLWFTIARPRPMAWLRFAGFAGTVLLLKVPVISRQLSLEPVTGLAAALAALWLLRGAAGRWAAGLGTTAVVAGFLVDGLRPEGVRWLPGIARSMNWVPFGRQLSNPLAGMVDLLSEAWPAVATACLVLHLVGMRARAVAMCLGAVLWLVLALGVELAQRWLPGRTPDLTNALVPPAAWILACWLVGRRAFSDGTGAGGDAENARVSTVGR